jgi:hypothetical protein
LECRQFFSFLLAVADPVSLRRRMSLILY